MSIDTEQFCHEMAQRLCTQAQKKYWFCSDFNVEIIDLCLETNDVVAAGKCFVPRLHVNTYFMELHRTDFNYSIIILFSAYMLVEADVPQTNQ